ncbi:ribose transport system substrate-binding protein [Scopulibacillus daqui]|uniref:Ribose transport system substrate-binding protein n=1 Tax=Scopulibacillus daqui TaxID=1469162 RepID=A0ABS2Q2Q1_9BACL|nr:sugar ABC transporter substrate-binding protein [Scopulibacillus daqui]MBM7646574.1 ribose transport system substrate-binding protein [Scopulibacillus daqui]
MKKRLSLSLIFLILLGVVLTGCSNNDANVEAKSKPTIVVVLKTLSSQYWKFVEAGAKKAGEDHNANVIILGPSSEGSILDQVNLVEDSLTKKPDAMVVSPSQPPTLIPVFKKAKKMGVPILLVDTDADWDDKTSFLGTDNVTAGRQAGNLLAQKLKPGDKVVLIDGALGNTATDARSKGAKEALEKQHIKVVAEQPADSDKAEAEAVMSNILQVHPDINGVYCANDDMAIGAARAIQAHHLKVPIIGTDGTIEAVNSILKGDLAGTIAQKPYDMGYRGVVNALRAAGGKSVKKRIDTGVAVISKENAKKELSFLQKILGQ